MGMAVHKISLCFVRTDQWASGQQCVEVRKIHYPCLKCHENEDKIDNDLILRNDQRIKTTQPISMILVSFFSEDKLFYVMKLKYAIFLDIKIKQIECSTF